MKISDFGLTKELRDSNGYQSRGETEVLPVRWKSIEALIGHVFTKQSDVVRSIFFLKLSDGIKIWSQADFIIKIIITAISGLNTLKGTFCLFDNVNHTSYK